MKWVQELKEAILGDKRADLRRRAFSIIRHDRKLRAAYPVVAELPKGVDWLKPRSPYPPTECPIKIFADGKVRLVEREAHVEKHSDDMVYYELERVGSHNYRRTNREFKGEFHWTYP